MSRDIIMTLRPRTSCASFSSCSSPSRSYPPGLLRPPSRAFVSVSLRLSAPRFLPGQRMPLHVLHDFLKQLLLAKKKDYRTMSNWVEMQTYLLLPPFRLSRLFLRVFEEVLSRLELKIDLPWLLGRRERRVNLLCGFGVL